MGAHYRQRQETLPQLLSLKNPIWEVVMATDNSSLIQPKAPLSRCFLILRVKALQMIQAEGSLIFPTYPHLGIWGHFSHREYRIHGVCGLLWRKWSVNNRTWAQDSGRGQPCGESCDFLIPFLWIGGIWSPGRIVVRVRKAKEQEVLLHSRVFRI